MKIAACAKPIIHVCRKNYNRKWINCSDCIYSKTVGDHKIVCTLFKYLTASPHIDYVDIIQCRSDFSLCGPYAEFFTSKKKD